ncbi:MAG TPA: GTP 3',8-cyclase MoaA [Allosphingosinicella sp.]|uniref:GTP 3',8-cyclase MoaA n=1 Tax=Allosphingosinicella sp. TaxID=2823234 RepID=UPI002ED7AE65
MIDPFGRAITYLRLSVTDRCDLRCTYCMPQRMTFLPKKELLTLEELDRLSAAFIRRGIRKLRLTGGEPLVRRDIMWLVERLSRFLGTGELDELTLTTNGTRLAHHAADLARLGVRRINVSLDSLEPETYARITRGGTLAETVRGIDAALDAGIEVKINTVALREDNLEQAVGLAEWAHSRGAGITFIEVMPMGSVEADRLDQFVPLTEVRRRLEERWTLTDTTLRTGGPARYARTDQGGTIGFITPLSHNFCGSCNRIRVTCTGQLFMCLGQTADADLRTPLRAWADDAPLEAAIAAAIERKPKGHDFAIRRSAPPAVERHMSVTGG